MPKPGGIPVYDEDWPQVCWDRRLRGALWQSRCRDKGCCGCHCVGKDELTVCIRAEDAAASLSC